MYIFLLFVVSSFSIVAVENKSIDGPNMMKLVWLPSDQKPPNHLSREITEGPLSQLPYIDVSPSRAPKQLLGARY